MNKKIFTLLVGALMLLGSSFMVNAQRTVPYLFDGNGDKKSSGNETLFYDILTADTVHKLPDQAKSTHYYLLSITDIANPDGDLANALKNSLFRGNSAAGDPTNSIDSTFVMYLDSARGFDDFARLRIERIARLDTAYSFNSARSNISYKIGALRRASWCVKYSVDLDVQYSRANFEFTNLHTGLQLALPGKEYLRYTEDKSPRVTGLTNRIADGGRSYLFGDSLNMSNSEFNLTDWHFSQSYHHDQKLQTGMPLYQYTNHDDSVAVLVLSQYYADSVDVRASQKDVFDGLGALHQFGRDNTSNSNKTIDGGYTVTVKIVALRDLIKDPQGNVRLVSDNDAYGTDIKNVLLFTLKKVNPFVMNADDWNSVDVEFGPAPTSKVTNNQMRFTDKSYLNPFTNIKEGKSYNSLRAFEVNDSLYHYGYMNFQARGDQQDFATNSHVRGHWLYVDTAFVNDGNNKTLAFNWSAGRRDSTLGGLGYESAVNNRTFIWGESYTDRKNSDATKIKAVPFDKDYEPISSYYTGSQYASATSWDYTVPGAQEAHAKFSADSATYVWAFMKDSIMENQAKFRVVYDPFEDRALINAYQTRVRHNYKKTYATDTWESPQWWENSFWIDQIEDRKDASGALSGENPTYGKLLRPSDYYTGFTHDGVELDNGSFLFVGSETETAIAGINGGGISITEAANNYYDLVINNSAHAKNNTLYHDKYRYSDSLQAGSGALGLVDVHGAVNDVALSINTSGTPRTWHDGLYGHGGFNFHSAMFAEPFSESTFMDRVMISTADTVSLFVKYNKYNNSVTDDVDWSALGHIYSYSVTSKQQHNTTHSLKYQDSLFYVDLQGLDGKTVVTLAQNVDEKWDTKIQLSYGPKCDLRNVDPTRISLENDLYLIRNARGEYLSVPIWSATDSVYWVTPRENEDPTRMPSYQWAIVRRSNSSTVFTVTNREFPHVEYQDVWLPYSSTKKPTTFQGFNRSLGAISLAFNEKGEKSEVYGNALSKADAIGQNPVNAFRFDEEMESKIPLTTSFIRLNKEVKQDQLLGYKYLRTDSTIVDAWAFKYLNTISMNQGKPRYISWNGYDNAKDTLLRVEGTDKYDKLYFDLHELDYETVKYDAYGITLSKNSIMKDSAYYDYRDLYSKYSSTIYNGTKGDTLVFEKFGYWKEKVIDDLLPLARQAYRLFLHDYYKWHPTIRGHYVTLGGVEDNYVLADRMYAVQDYKKGSYEVNRLFGIPHFYFRNTHFDVQSAGDDYFAILQRLDTIGAYADDVEYDYASGGSPVGYDDIEEYLTKRFGSDAAGKVLGMYKDKKQRTAFVALVEDKDVTLKMALRGDAARRVSTFQLEVDQDPIYRRFHVNEPNENFRKEMGDKPDTLVFHTLNQGDAGFRLYENSGSYKSNDGDRHGPEGGRVYNYINGDYMRDTLGHVISFLGINVSTQYPSTNYSIYVDTAFINRGTGWIKPQYMLVVDPYKPTEELVCDPVTGEWYNINGQYVIGRYMYNTAMYAKELAKGGTPNFNTVQQVNQEKHRTINGKAYTYHNGTSQSLWERLAFSWAIHRGDSLYVLKGKTLEPLYNNNYVNDSRDVWQKLADEYGNGTSIDFDELIDQSTLKTFDGKDSVYKADFFNGDTVVKGREYRNFKNVSQYAAGKTIGLHAIINLADNTHKDWVFSMRYVERGASDFVIESETTDRDVFNGAVIRPGYGGWVKFDNGVPVITRSDENEVMAEAYEAVFNVKPASEYYKNGDKKNPVDNDNIAKVTVIGGAGSVTIMNAADKNVVITNILGQTVVNTTITSANATISVPAGVVVVAVEGESAVKAVVK